jgi:hypothetical protein
VKPGGELVHVRPVSSAHGVDSFFEKLGQYTIKTKVNPYSVWDDKADRIVEIEGDVNDEVEIPELNSEINLRVRRPTEAERGAFELLAKSPEGAKMIGMRYDGKPNPGHGFGPASNDKGTRVMRQIAEQFPSTIYADHANYVLGRTLSVKDREGNYLKEETSREQVAYLDKVGEHSRLLQRRAVVWKYIYLTDNPSAFPDADWNELASEIELNSDIDRMSSMMSVYMPSPKKHILRVAKEMAKDGRIDLGDLE